MRAPFLVLALLLLGAQPPSPGTATEAQPAVSVAEECCKICHKGKARGDTCIARDKDCHKPPGCACDE